VSQFDDLHKLVKRVSKAKGGVEITSLEDITAEDISKIEFEPEPEEYLPDLGQYFNKYQENMVKGIPVTKVPGRGLGKYTCFLLVFVADHDGLYDSVIA